MYRLAGDDVYHLLAAVRTIATERIAEAERAARAFVGGAAEIVSRAELLERVRAGEAIVVDLRPGRGVRGRAHLRGRCRSRSMSFEARLADLPADVEVVAYCRGPYCALAPPAWTAARAGRRARRLEEGFPEWRLAGLPVVTGTLPA